jgi:large subunit ribosomal protein L23
MAEFHYGDILVRPIYSEKSNILMMKHKYVFIISPRAAKTAIRRAISERFNVTVTDVNIINLPRKPKRAERNKFVTEIRRKAVVTLAEGQTIPELSEAL